MVKVSIIMPVYNAEKYVADSIKSVLNQTFNDFELIIINDGSTDKSEKIIKQFDDSRIKYFRFNKNKGKCAAVNFCIKKSKGKYLQFFDADDIMLNHKLDLQVQILDSDSTIGLIYSDAWKMSEYGKIIGPYVVPSSTNKKITDSFVYNKFDYEKLKQINYIPACSTMFTKKAVNKAGLFDKRLKAAEDWDMWLRIAEKFKVFYLHVPVYCYRYYGQSLSRRLRKNNEFEQYDNLVREKIRQRQKKYIKHTTTPRQGYQ